ncbi:hypothetical protein BXY41_106179 [Lacrimispora xylanisolvens]|uniref:Uncharacterized protein n=1 Tax=Lacrimispora xylanisolvens TaxID=384636 RepID=A0A2S6HSK7_9FIRM|nr:hypothetical protein [Hungatella xylanolytica]PPK80589.1 hypothetical protein BXY41_106179 [Hungatella xylanolytica]
MGKKSVVVEIMEKRLSPYDFQYVDYNNLIWTFSREVEGVEQYIAIQKSQWENSYALNLYVYGVGLPIYRTKELINDPKYNWDFLSFNNQQDQREVLNKLLDVAEKYGIDKLNELANEKKVMVESPKPTTQMYKKLYEENAVLMKQFMSRINAVDLPEADILQLLKKELEEIQGEMYEDIQDKLVELASVYGNMLIKKLGGRWEYVKSSGKASVDIPLFCRCNILVDFIEAWQKGEENLIIKNFNHKCNEVINWVRQCRALYGEDWQPPETKYKMSLDNYGKI